MSKNRKQMLLATLILAVLLAGYFGVKEYNDSAGKRQEEEAAAKVSQVTAFDIADVTAFSYSSADAEVSMKMDQDTWKCVADETLEIDTEKVESFLENFNAMESENEILEAENTEEFGLDEPIASITFEFADGESLTCNVGGYNDVMAVYYFAVNAGDAVYTVDAALVNKLSNTVDNFVVEEIDEIEETED